MFTTTSIQTHNLSLQTKDKYLLTNLNWQVHAKECWCVIGRNGAGKSTLLRTLANLQKPHSGSIQLNGQVLTTWTPQALARQRAFLPQKCSDAFGHRVIDIVLIARHPYQNRTYWESWESDADHQSAQEALQKLNIAHLAQRDSRTLSGGERQRVAIAATLAQDTPLLLLDEPTNGLDLAHQISAMELFHHLCQQTGKAIVIVSHDLNLTSSIATHALLLMGDGEWQAGPVADIMRAETLSQCLGYPIEEVRHEGRVIYLPARKYQAGSTKAKIQVANDFDAPLAKDIQVALYD